MYFVAGVGVVFDKGAYANKQRSQRYFFGHSNNVLCMAMHPNRRFVATGQQRNDDRPDGRPYVCVWDTEDCTQLQRIDHGEEMRGVIACAFSGSALMGERDKGGDVLVSGEWGRGGGWYGW